MICDETIYYEAKIDEFGVYHTEIGEFREKGIPRLLKWLLGVGWARWMLNKVSM